VLNYKLKIDSDAVKDIQLAVAWYELQLQGLGVRYKTQVKSK
jgi:hypothetical protein